MTSTLIPETWDQVVAWQTEPWGHILDAGTGDSSFSWMLGLNSLSCTAITASLPQQQDLWNSYRPKLRLQDRLILGNWNDPMLLKDEVFDVVLAQYLLGAVERFSPYFEAKLLGRLWPLVGKRLYFVGMEPPRRPQTPAEEVMVELFHFRDAIYLLSGSRHYREYPLEWVVQNLDDHGYRVLDIKTFPNQYGKKFLEQFFLAAGQHLESIDSPSLKTGLLSHLCSLEERAFSLLEDQGLLQCSFDYALAAEPRTERAK